MCDCRPMLCRDRGASDDYSQAARRQGLPHVPCRSVEATHQARRLRGQRRESTALDEAGEGRDRYARCHRGGHPRARGACLEIRNRHSLGGCPHICQPIRHAGPRRQLEGRRRACAGEEPCEPRPGGLVPSSASTRQESSASAPSIADSPASTRRFTATCLCGRFL